MEGEVVLRSGLCTLQANLLERSADGRLRLEQPSLRDGRGVRLRAYRLWGAGGGQIRAEWIDLWPCRCGLSQPIWLRARRARFDPADGRIHLWSPALGLSGVPLLIAPYWSFATRPGSSGLLAPRIGYSGRDGLRVTQPVYLAWRRRADLGLAAGLVLYRGPTAAAQLRYFAGQMGAGDVSLRGIVEEGRIRGWLRGAVQLRSDRWTVQIEPRLVSDGAILSDLADTTLLQLARYQRSRVLLGFWHELFDVAGWIDLYQPVGEPSDLGTDHLWRGQLRLAIAPVLIGPLALSLDAEVVGIGDAAAQLGAVVGSDGVRRLTRGAGIWVAPSLSLQRQLGPVRAAMALGYRLRGAWPDAAAGGPADEDALFHAALGVAELGLPLTRVFGRGSDSIRHDVELFAVWQSLLQLGRGSSDTALYDQPLLVPGHAVGPGLRTQIWSVGQQSRSLVKADSRLMFAESGTLLSLQAQGAPQEWLRANLGLLVGLSDLRLISAEGQVCAASSFVETCAGYRRQRALWPSLLPVAADTLWPQVGALPAALLVANWLDLVSGRLVLELGRLRLGAEVFIDPFRGTFTHGRYWASLLDSCRCLGLEMSGRSRPGARVPDLLLSVRFAPDWGASCLASLR